MMRVRRVVAGLAAASLMGAGAVLAPHMAGAAPADEGDAAPKLEVTAKKLDEADFSKVKPIADVVPEFPWIGESTVFEVTVTGCYSNVEGEEARVGIIHSVKGLSPELPEYNEYSPNGKAVFTIAVHNKVAKEQEEAGIGIAGAVCESPNEEFDGLRALGYLPFDGKPTIDINAKGDAKDEDKSKDKQDDKSKDKQDDKAKDKQADKAKDKQADKAKDKQADKADKAKDNKAKKGKKPALPSTGV